MKRSAFLLVSVLALLAECPALGQTVQDIATDKSVAVLIERMLKPETEQRAFSDLESLGCAAVPAIIRRMDDRRSIPDPRMSLRNKSPQAFEGIRHYGPQQVVDALAAILNQLTGQNFGFIYNGATDEERTKAIQGWRKYLESTPAANVCNGKPSTAEVHDASSAVRIAEAAFIKRYGQSLVESERPFSARLNDGVWHVSGTLHCRDAKGNVVEGCVGGTAEADIRQSDGRILRLLHTK